MRTDVCAIEWDGASRLSVTIDIYLFVYEVRNDRMDLQVSRMLMMSPFGWIGVHHDDYVHGPSLARLAQQRAYEHWSLYANAYGAGYRERPAFRLFHDPTQEHFDRRVEVAAMIAAISAHVDMHAQLRRS